MCFIQEAIAKCLAERKAGFHADAAITKAGCALPPALAPPTRINTAMRVAKAWGEEEWLCNTPLYCGKLLRINRGWSCSLHYHIHKDETFYLLGGLVMLEANGLHRLSPGDSIHIPPGTLHRFTGLEQSTIIEISTHHDDGDVVRLEQSKPVAPP